jgi:monooxygenase
VWPVTSEHVDVLIVGAGLSGVSAACHLRRRCPRKSYAILEAREGIGGTWDLFRYPGIRSDSDMFTLGFSFRPWREGKAIADGPSILDYIRTTAAEQGVDRAIRFGHRVVRAAWSSQDARWTVDVERGGESVTMTCAFLLGCTGYFRYDKGHTPALPGIERFGGEVVHPQQWTDDVDDTGKRVVVIGSGATAVTLVPALAERAAHVTMLQRTPSYVVALPARDPVADLLRRRLPPRVAHPIVRWKNVLMTMASYQLSRRSPRAAKALIRLGLRLHLQPGYDLDTHFTPPYDPWDQRLCLVPDGDLFKALRRGDASIVTDRIATFTERGIRLASGAELEADLVVTATGLELLALGGIALTVDGRAVDPSQCLSYKGAMLSGVPNLALTIGYTNASWTLKCELICEYVCRLLDHMDEHGFVQATPRADHAQPTEPFLGLTAGYVQRAIDRFPRQGAAAPWRVHQNYLRDVKLLRFGPVDDAMELRRYQGTGPNGPPPSSTIHASSPATASRTSTISRMSIPRTGVVSRARLRAWYTAATVSAGERRRAA